MEENGRECKRGEKQRKKGKKGTKTKRVRELTLSTQGLYTFGDEQQQIRHRSRSLHNGEHHKHSGERIQPAYQSDDEPESRELFW